MSLATADRSAMLGLRGRRERSRPGMHEHPKDETPCGLRRLSMWSTTRLSGARRRFGSASAAVAGVRDAVSAEISDFLSEQSSVLDSMGPELVPLHLMASQMLCERKADSAGLLCLGLRCCSWKSFG